MKQLKDYEPGDPVLIKEWDTPVWHEGIVEEYNGLGSPNALVGRYVVPVNGYSLWERREPNEVQPDTSKS